MMRSTSQRYADSLRGGTNDNNDAVAKILAAHGIRYSGKYEHLDNPESEAGFEQWREDRRAKANHRALVRAAQKSAQAATQTQAERVAAARLAGPAAAKEVLRAALARLSPKA